jgi:hypothetical protein
MALIEFSGPESSVHAQKAAAHFSRTELARIDTKSKKRVIFLNGSIARSSCIMTPIEFSMQNAELRISFVVKKNSSRENRGGCLTVCATNPQGVSHCVRDESAGGCLNVCATNPHAKCTGGPVMDPQSSSPGRVGQSQRSKKIHVTRA